MISSAPCMGGAAWTKAEISSGSGSGTTRDFGSVGSSAPHTLATKVRPMSRQYESVGWRLRAQLGRAQVEHAGPAARSEGSENALLHGSRKLWTFIG